MSAGKDCALRQQPVEAAMVIAAETLQVVVAELVEHHRDNEFGFLRGCGQDRGRRQAHTTGIVSWEYLSGYHANPIRFFGSYIPWKNVKTLYSGTAAEVSSKYAFRHKSNVNH